MVLSVCSSVLELSTLSSLISGASRTFHDATVSIYTEKYEPKILQKIEQGIWFSFILEPNLKSIEQHEKESFCYL